MALNEMQMVREFDGTRKKKSNKRSRDHHRIRWGCRAGEQRII